MKNREISKNLFRLLVYFVFLQVFYFSYFLPCLYYKPLSFLFGNIAFFTMRKTRKRVIYNLSIAFRDRLSEREKIKITKRFFCELCLNFLEVIKITKIPFDEYKKMIDMDGEDTLKKISQRKTGAVAICAHLGNFPVIQTFLAKKKYPISMIVRHSNNLYLTRFNNRLLKKLGVPFVSKWNLNAAIKYSKMWLKNGGIVCFYIDQHAGNGVDVEFFGRKVFTPVGAAVFTRKYKCPVIGIFTYRKSDGTHKLIIEGPYKFEFTKDVEKDIKNMTCFFMKRVEYYVKLHPEQWFTWLHRRFR